MKQNVLKFSKDGKTVIGVNGNYTSIIIPDGVTSIGYRAFNGCSSLKEVHLYHKQPNDISIDDDTFDETSYDNCILFIPSGSRWKYRHHPVFGKFEHIEIE